MEPTVSSGVSTSTAGPTGADPVKPAATAAAATATTGTTADAEDGSRNSLEDHIDPEIRERQLDWLSELASVQLENYVSVGDKSLAEVTDKYGLGAIWIFDSLYARSIDFPQNDVELLFYRLSRSRLLRLCYNLAVILQILLPFFAPSGCSYSSKFTTVQNFIVIDVVCLIIYLLDLFLLLAVNNAKKSVLKKPWTAFRVFCCLLLFLDCIGYSDYAFSGIRLVRCLFPFFLISRRTNLQKMFQGIFVSGVKSMSVIIALMSVLIMWAFVGFLVFRNISSEAGSTRFDNIPSSLFATLHCFTSRPFCLLALRPFFAVSQISAVFFVTLTLAADVLCIGLIVAIGTSEYKLFAAYMMNRRLTSRLRGLQIVFDAFAVDGQFSRDSWISVCDRLRYGYRCPPGEALLMFSLEDPGDTGLVDFDGYLRLCALLACKVTIVVPKEMLTDISNALSKPEVSVADIVATHNVIIVSDEVDVSPDDMTILGSHVDDKARERVRSSQATSAAQNVKWEHQLKVVRQHFEAYRNACYFMATAYITFDVPSLSHMRDPVPIVLTLRSIGSAINHFLLVIYLSFISAGNADIGWYRFGQAIEFFFWLDMIIKLSAFGYKTYMRALFNRAEAIVNFASFISLCVMGTASGPKSSALVATLVIQSFRFLGLFFLVNDFEIFEMIFPIMIRAGFIYFSVVYFYAIFAHTFFCGSLNTTAASAGDDDSQNWVQFASELNFSSYLQALFTMFEMSLLANWSIVMDAAAKVAGIGSFFFFYTYRLMVTLFVLPILLGFVMQAFLAARRKKSVLDTERQRKLLADREALKVAKELKERLNQLDEPEKNISAAAEQGVDEQKPIVVRESFEIGSSLLDLESNNVEGRSNSSDVFRNSSSSVLGSSSLADLNISISGMEEERRSSLFDRRSLPKLTPDVTFGSLTRKGGKKYSVSSNSRRSSTSRLDLWNADGVKRSPRIDTANLNTPITASSSSNSNIPGPSTVTSSINPMILSKHSVESQLQDQLCLLETISKLRESLNTANGEIDSLRRRLALSTEDQTTLDR
jgi:hypothetical protein